MRKAAFILSPIKICKLSTEGIKYSFYLDRHHWRSDNLKNNELEPVTLVCYYGPAWTQR